MLAGEMPAAAAAMAAAASPVSDDASLFERLLASAESLIDRLRGKEERIRLDLGFEVIQREST